MGVDMGDRSKIESYFIGKRVTYHISCGTFRRPGTELKPQCKINNTQNSTVRYIHQRGSYIDGEARSRLFSHSQEGKRDLLVDSTRDDTSTG